MPTLTESPTVPTRVRWFMPWRSVTAGWLVAALALLVGVPFFLCLPPWVDVTLYDMAARSILHGGVYYRDVFDTNLPGVAWVMAVVRLLFGWSYEVLRAFDLLVIAGEVALLLLWVRRAGAANYTVAWLAAAAALYYPFTSEFSHMQRDAWMLLPVLIAARLRLARTEREDRKAASSLLEGFVWGLAVWIKPHVVIPAFLVWIASAVLIARRESLRAILADLAWLVLGGLLAGALGVAWLVGTGAWPYFLEVFLKWNPNYVAGVFDEAGDRFFYTFEVFRPWGLLHNLAIPLALLSLWAGLRRQGNTETRGPGDKRSRWQRLRSWVYLPANTEAVANARMLLAMVYLGWLIQVILFQKGFEYAQVPVLLLGMSIIATHRWSLGFLYLLWFAFLALLLNGTSLVSLTEPPGFPAIKLEHYRRLTEPHPWKLWPRCWREGSSPELRDQLGVYIDIHCAVNWEELSDVANFLRTLDPPLRNGELNCWHDGTHPLYLMLDLDPATRYMHFGTVFGITSKDDWIKKRIAKEVAESRQRYVVADLARLALDRVKPHLPGPGNDPQKLPSWFPESAKDKFPWNQKLVFRSGRYVVYQVVNELGEIDVPEWPPAVEPEAPR